MTDFEKNAMRQMLDIGAVPSSINSRLQATYDSLPPMKQKNRSKSVLRTLLVAAALMMVLSTGVMAATGTLQPAIEKVIAFFSSNESHYESIQPVLQAYNKEINETITDAGVSVTLNSVSADGNFVNLFATVTAPTINVRAYAANIAGEEMPQSYLGSVAAPYLHVKIGEKKYDSNGLSDGREVYFKDENTLEIMQRVPVQDALPDTFTMEILVGYYENETGAHYSVLDQEGTWNFSVPMDITAAKAKTLVLAPQEISIETTDGVKKLDLKKCEVSPLGITMTNDFHIEERESTLPDGTKTTQQAPAEGYMTLGEVVIRDQNGNYLYQAPYGAVGLRESAFEYSNISETITALTFVPVRWDLNDPANGTPKLETASLTPETRVVIDENSGYTLKKYTVEGRHVELVFSPYGPKAPGADTSLMELKLLDASGNEVVNSARSHWCLVDQSIDHATGDLIVTQDFYQDEPNLVYATQFSYYVYGKQVLDEAHAVTLPLIPKI